MAVHFGQFLLADLLITVPPRARPFVKVGGHVPPRALWSRRPCSQPICNSMAGNEYIQSKVRVFV